MKNTAVVRVLVFAVVLGLSPTGLEVLSLFDAPKLAHAVFIILATLVEIAIVQRPVRKWLSRLSIDREGPLGSIVSVVLPDNRPSDGQLKRNRQAVLGALRDQLGQVKQESAGQPSLKLELLPLPAAVQQVDKQEPDAAWSGSIQDVYKSSREQLLILGQAGAGKSTVLRELCGQLIDQAELDSTAQFPILLDLSRWAGEQQLLADWISEELHEKFKISPPVTRFWVEHEEMAAVLDGLDEVRDDYRKACVDAINEFHTSHAQIPIVVSCRTAYYTNLPRLALRAAVEVQALTATQVDEYLAKLGERAVGLRATVQADPQLQEMMTNPLFLSIASGTYQGRSETLARSSTVEERRDQVLADYAAARLEEWRSPLSRERVLPWLEWLAVYMKKHENTFRLDWLQRDALASARQETALSVATTIVWLLVGATLSVAFALICDLLAITVRALGLPHLPAVTFRLPAGGFLSIGLPYDLGTALVVAAALGAFGGLIVGWLDSSREMEPKQRISAAQLPKLLYLPIWGGAFGILAAATLGSLGAILSAWINPDLGRLDKGSVGTGSLALMTAGIDALICAVTIGTAMRLWIPALTSVGGYVGFIYGALLGYSYGLGGGLGPWMLAGAFGWGSGIQLGINGALAPQAFLKPTNPGEAIRISKRNAAIGGIVGFLIGGLAIGPLMTLFQAQARQFGAPNIYTALFITAVLGLISGLAAAHELGGGTYVRHRLLLWQLTRQGVAPPDYVGSLQEAARVAILRRRGGGYQFLHRLLLEYFDSRRTKFAALDQGSAGPSGAKTGATVEVGDEVPAMTRL